jgi:hypothetical protein
VLTANSKIVMSMLIFFIDLAVLLLQVFCGTTQLMGQGLQTNE